MTIEEFIFCAECGCSEQQHPNSTCDVFRSREGGTERTQLVRHPHPAGRQAGRITIEEFIQARLVEDEAIANRELADWDEDVVHGVDVKGTVGSGPFEHIVRHGPDRALGQAPVLRAVVELIQGMVSASQQVEAENTVLYPLAAIWDKHPDYRPEWKP